MIFTNHIRICGKRMHAVNICMHVHHYRQHNRLLDVCLVLDIICALLFSKRFKRAVANAVVKATILVATMRPRLALFVIVLKVLEK
jgi:hypothetical protein